MPRRRRPENEDLEDNVYTKSSRGTTYFEYRDPLTGKSQGLGADRDAANARARELNGEREKELGSARRDTLRNQMRGGDANVARVLERFWEEFVLARDYSERTRDEMRIKLNWYRKRIGKFALRGVTRKSLDVLWKDMKPHARSKHRALWILIYRFAISVGLADVNEAEMTLAPTAKSLQRRTHRHTIEGYDTIFAAAPDWLQIAMEILLTSLQRREDAVTMRRDDVKRTLGGYTIEVVPSKPNHRLLEDDQFVIQIEVANGTRLFNALQRALTVPIASPFVICRIPERRRPTRNRHWTQVTAGYLSKAFAHVRDQSGAYSHIDPQLRPGIHQLRALGSKLYEEAGYDVERVQMLMGHSDPSMTKRYQAGHDGRRVIPATAGL